MMMTMIMISITYITFTCVNFFNIWNIFHISTHLIQQSYEESVFMILSLPFPFYLKMRMPRRELRHFFVFFMLSGSRVCLLTTMLTLHLRSQISLLYKEVLQIQKNNQQIRKSYCSRFAGKLNRFTH